MEVARAQLYSSNYNGKIHRMKWSRYNLLFKSNEIGNILFNSRTLALLRLDDYTFHIFNNLRVDSQKFICSVDEADLRKLQDLKILVNDEEDDQFLYTLQYNKQIRSYNSRLLGIIVCPTLSCNFSCPYCYEHNLPNFKMNEATQDNLVEFINKHKKGMDGFVLNWHGGEPLIAFETIKQLYEKIEEKSELAIVHSSMVTNGYLLDEEKCRFFASHNLNYMQITVDGNKETHDKTRKLKNGDSSYETILHNIDMALEIMPNCKIGIRTNISKNNKDGYIDLYRELTDRWKSKNCVVYHAFVLDNEPRKLGIKNHGFELTANEKNFFVSNLADCGIISRQSLYPTFDAGIYTCMDNNAYVISPKGEIYKCWADVGKKGREIGDLDKGLTNSPIIAEFMTCSDKYSDQRCKVCSLLPICTGGCNLCRMDKNRSLCTDTVCDFSEQGLIKILETYMKNGL